MQFLADYGHELMLLQVWSEEDRTPPWAGELELVDGETDVHLKLDFDDLAREQYTRAFDQYAADLQQLALRNSGRYVGISTQMAIEDVIFGSLVRARGIA